MKLKDLHEGKGWAADLAAANRAKTKKISDDKKAAAAAHAADEKRFIQAEKDSKKFDDAALFHKITNRLGDTFPDLDPFDVISPFMKRYGITYDQVNAIFKKHGGKGEKSVDDYMSNMYHDMQADAIHDAESEIKKNPEASEHERGPYFEIKDGKVVPHKNPYK